MKLGKLPARPGAVSFSVRDYTTGLPVPPVRYGHQGLVSNWQMLGNDQYGDCVWAGAGHETMLWNKEAGKDVAFTDTEVLSDYSKVTGFNASDPSTDNGTDMTVAASYRRKTGVVAAGNGRHKVAAYLAVTLKDPTLLKQAVYLFSGVGIGIQFPSSAMTQFNAGKPWTVTKSAIEGGHYIPAVGYDSKYIYVVTWGKVQKMTWGFYKKYADEALAYLSLEFLLDGKNLEGFNLSQLQGDLSKL